MSFKGEGSFSIDGNSISLVNGISLEDASGAAIGIDLLLTQSQIFSSEFGLHLNGAITLNGDLYLSSSNDIQVNGDISGSYGLEISGNGRVILAGDNSFVGDINIEGQGDFRLMSNSAAGNSENTVRNSDTSSIIIEGEGLLISNNFEVSQGTTLYNIGDGNELTGSIDVGVEITTYVQDGDLEMSGVISGGKMFKYGDGVLKFSGSESNTFSGGLEIQMGEVVLAKTGEAIALPGAVIIGDDSGSIQTSILSYEQGEQIADLSDVTIFSDGIIHQNGYNETFRTLYLSSGLLDTDGGDLVLDEISGNSGEIGTDSGEIFLNGDMELTESDGVPMIFIYASTLHLLDSETTFSIPADTFIPVSIYAEIESEGDIYIDGIGMMFAAENADLKGDIYVGGEGASPSLLGILSTLSLGDISGSTYVGDGSSLYVANYYDTFEMGFYEDIYIEGDGLGDFLGIDLGAIGFIPYAPAPIYLLGQVILTGDARITTVEGSAAFIFSITGSYDVTLEGSGTFMEGVILSGDSGYEGSTTVIDTGFLLLDENILSENHPIILHGFAWLILQESQKIGSLSGDGLIMLEESFLYLGNDNSSSSFSGGIEGVGLLVKEGEGVFTANLEGAGISGGFAGLDGRLNINGEALSLGVYLDEDGELGGQAELDSLMSEGGIIDPGNSPGIMSFENDFVLTEDSRVIMQVQGDSVGTEYDKILIGGDAQLEGTLEISVETELPEGTELPLFEVEGTLETEFDEIEIDGQATSEYEVKYTAHAVVLVASLKDSSNDEDDPSGTPQESQGVSDIADEENENDSEEDENEDSASEGNEEQDGKNTGPKSEDSDLKNNEFWILIRNILLVSFALGACGFIFKANFKKK